MSKHSDSVPAWPNGSVDLNAVHEDAKAGRDFAELGFVRKHLPISEVEAIPEVEAQTDREMAVVDKVQPGAVGHE